MMWGATRSRLRVVLPVALVALCFVSGACLGDHPDRVHQAIGAPETALSGVRINVPAPNAMLNDDGVYIEAMTSVVKTLGKPTKVIAKNNCESDYVWIVDAVRVETYSGCVYEAVAGKEVMRTHGAYGVEVWGTRASGNIGVTGRGLALGDSWAKMKRLYGMHCECGRYTSGTGTQDTHGLKYARYAKYQWGVSVELNVDVDANGRVVHMQLLGDLE